jgi:hypothetical protein
MDNDNAIATATVTVTVNAVANKAPVADAGPDQTIVVTANSTTLTAEQSVDPDGTITNYVWQQLSGPGTSVFSSTIGKTVDVSNLVIGEYVYRLTVRDNKNATATATVKVIVIDNFRNFTTPIVVYPNPTTDVVNVRLLNPKPGRVTINVYDMSGKAVLPTMLVNKPAGSYSVPVSVVGLTPAGYVIQVSTLVTRKWRRRLLSYIDPYSKSKRPPRYSGRFCFMLKFWRSWDVWEAKNPLILTFSNLYKKCKL